MTGRDPGSGLAGLAWRRTGGGYTLLLLLLSGAATSTLAGCAASSPAGAGRGRGPAGLPGSMEDYARPDEQPPPGEIFGPVDGEGSLSVILIDVGQGDAILIDPPGPRAILVDAGAGSGAGKAARELMQQEIERVDLFLATHAHDDHIGGFTALAKRFGVRLVLDPLYPQPGPAYESYLRHIRRSALSMLQARGGMGVQVGGDYLGVFEPASRDGTARGVVLGNEAAPREVRVRVPPELIPPDAVAGGPGAESAALPLEVQPPADLPLLDLRQGTVLRFYLPPEPFITDSRSNGNANSVVFRLSYKDVCMIFTGDAEAETEHLLRATVPAAELSCPVLKIPHHGGAYSSTDALLDGVKPQISLISAGRFNRYGHPAPQTIHKLVKRGSWIFRTDKMGTVRLRTDGTKIQVEIERTQEYWKRYFQRKKHQPR